MEEIQEDLAVVKSIEGKTVIIEMQKNGSCDSCAMSGICAGNDKTYTHKIETEMTLKIGDIVRVHIAPSIRIFSSFLLFVFPILMMILMYTVAKLLHSSENIAIITSFIGLIISGIIIYILDKKIGRKINFEIIERISK